MGHYYADLMCDKCGELRCVCPTKREPSITQWYVNDHFAVVVVRPMVYFRHMKGEIEFFKTKQSAEAAVPRLIRAKIDDLNAEIAVLEAMLAINEDIP